MYFLFHNDETTSLVSFDLISKGEKDRAKSKEKKTEFFLKWPFKKNK